MSNSAADGPSLRDDTVTVVPNAPDPAPWASSGWSGMVVFGGMMLSLTGAVHVITGFAAVFDSGYYDVPSDDLALLSDYTAWGWVHLVLGVVAIATGWGLIAGRYWAHGVGIGLASLSAVTSLLFANAQPWWAVTVIVLDVLVILAIVRHDPAELRRPE